MTQQRRTARTRAMQRRRKIIRRIERATGRVFTSFEEACTALVEIMMPVSTAVVEGLQAFALVWQNLVDGLALETPATKNAPTEAEVLVAALEAAPR